jgi:hypothetical protein
MNNYAIIETYSGFVWWSGLADSPESACYAADKESGGRGEPGHYEEGAKWLHTSRGVYDVREAPAGFVAEDGKDQDSIA